MTDKYLGDHALTNGDWVDLTTLFSDASGVASWVQNKGPGQVLLAYTDSAATPTSGALIDPGEIWGATGLHIWAGIDHTAMPATLAIGLGSAMAAPVSSGGGGIAGSVEVANFPAVQPVSGAVSVANFPATQPVSGSVSVANFPATQPVSGAVSVANFPATQPVSGAVSVANFPATQPVSGAVSVANFPATQAVSGSVNVANLPATQAITAAALPLPSGAATAGNQVLANTSLASISGQLPASLGAKAGAGSLSFAPATDLSNIEPAGAPITGQAMPAGGLGLTGWLSAIYYAGINSPLPAGSATIGAVITYLGYTDSIAALGASATYTGTTRTLSSSSSIYNYFNASAYADQAGTLYIDRTINTAATWEPIASAALAAGTTANLSARMTGVQGAATSYRVRFVNGATANTVFRLSSSATAN